MATAPQYFDPDGALTAPVEVADVLDIHVEYDEANDGVIVTPNMLKVGVTVRFIAAGGMKLRVAFLSPMGDETKLISDSDACPLVTAGAYPFKCYFTDPGTGHEISPKYGGVIDVSPHQP